MKRLRLFFTVLAFWVASLVSCSTASAFTGPVSDRPLLSIVQRRHFEMTDPRLPEQLVTISIAHVVNPSTSPMTVVLDCTESRHTLNMPARTSTDVLLDQHDSECVLR